MTTDEAARAASAGQYRSTPNPPESAERRAPRLERILALIGRALDFPGVRVTVHDERWQRTVDAVGPAQTHPLPREAAICDRVVRTGRPVAISDARADPGCRDLPEIAAGLTGSYLGVPLRGRESLVIGAVCVSDQRARDISDDQVQRLRDFALVVERVLEIRRRAVEQGTPTEDGTQPDASEPDTTDSGTATADPARPEPDARTLGPDAARRLRTAIADRAVRPWYKPVVDLHTDVLHGFELTPRWTPPGRVDEDARWIVPGGRGTDLLTELDLAVLREALPDLSGWLARRRRLQLAVPLNARALEDPSMPRVLAKMVETAGVPTLRVDLLLTDSACWSPRDTTAIATVVALRDLGFGVQLQGYGSGWTVLDQLLWLPADAVKIDASLSAALGTPVGDALASGVTGLADALGLRTVVGGLRSRRAADVAVGLGARQGLGELWSAAVPGVVAETLLGTRPGTRWGVNAPR